MRSKTIIDIISQLDRKSEVSKRNHDKETLEIKNNYSNKVPMNYFDIFKIHFLFDCR